MNVTVMYSRVSESAAAVVARSLCLFLYGASYSNKVVFCFVRRDSDQFSQFRRPVLPLVALSSFLTEAPPIRIKVRINTVNNFRLSFCRPVR